MNIQISLSFIYDIFCFRNKGFGVFATLSYDVVFEEAYQLVTFDNAEINEGGYCNITVGTNIAPVAGIYQISAHIRATPKGNLHIYLDGSSYVNPVEFVSSEFSSDGDGTTVLTSWP